jgi:Zn-dependent protease with chaperone function
MGITKEASKLLRFRGEIFSFYIVLVISLVLLYTLFQINTFLLIGSLVLGFFYIRVMQSQQLGNSIKVSTYQLPEIYKYSKECSEILGIKRIPDVYVTQDPVMNAYTIGFGKSYAIVINSGIIENLEDEEIRCVVAHELGHIKFKHTQFLSIISPIGRYLAFADILFGFWGRKTEYSADRCALICIQNKEVVLKTLIKVAVGGKSGARVDLERLSIQLQNVKASKIGGIGELMGSHPFILKRVWELNKFTHEYNLKPCTNCGNLLQGESKFCEVCGNPK